MVVCILFLHYQPVTNYKRAFKQWSTGHFFPLNAHQFSKQTWGFATNKIMNSVEKVSEQKWKKIYIVVLRSISRSIT